MLFGRENRLHTGIVWERVTIHNTKYEIDIEVGDVVKIERNERWKWLHSKCVSQDYVSKPLYIDYLKFICKDKWNKLSIAHMNINSIRNNFDLLIGQIKVNNVDILMIPETKFDYVNQVNQKSH